MPNYLKDIKINSEALDIEWLEQAELAVKYGRYWSKCKEELIRAEENVKIVTAELTIEINQNPEKYLGDGVKPTDVKIDAAVRTHSKFQEAKERWITAITECNDAEIIKNEIAFTRKSALEALVQLHGQQYFAGPKVPRNLIEERKKRSEEVKENNKKIRMRKRSV